MAGKTGIRGEQIKDGSIDSVDIASGSIKAGELSEKVIADQALITSTDTTNDRLLIWDATDSALKQVSIGNLGVTASPAGSDTQVQYNNSGATGGASKLLYDDSNHRLGIGSTNAPDYTLDVAGDIGLSEYIYHKGDDDTYIQFEDDTIILAAGGRSFIKLEEADQDKVIINHGALNIDLKVGGENNANLIRTDAANDRVGIGIGTPTSTLHVAGETHLSSSSGTEVLRIAKADGDTREIVLENEGTDAASIYLNSAEHLFIRQENASNDLCLRIAATNAIRIDGSTSRVGIFNDSPAQTLDVTGIGQIGGLYVTGSAGLGIGTTSPAVALDVHHDPTSLADNTGGGEVVTFGTEDQTDTLAAGKLMLLDSNGVWKYTDANAPAASGGVLLAIALGTSVADGLLIRGFFDAATIQGSFIKGGVCYISEVAGTIDFTAPSGVGDTIRVVGYGTDTANVIYFNPSSTWIEL